MRAGKADEELIGPLAAGNEMYGLELFPIVAAVVASGNQLKGKRIILFRGNNAKAGYPVRAPSGEPLSEKNSSRVSDLLDRRGAVMREPSGCAQSGRMNQT